MTQPESEPLVTIAPRERKTISVFGQTYEFKRPDEGTKAEHNEVRQLGTRIERIASKPTKSDVDINNLVRDARRLMQLLLPHLPDAEIQFLTVGDMAAIAAAWSREYGDTKPSD